MSRAAISTAERDKVIDALRDCWEYFDKRADTDCAGDPLEYIPNEEMRLLFLVHEALKALGVQS